MRGRADRARRDPSTSGASSEAPASARRELREDLLQPGETLLLGAGAWLRGGFQGHPPSCLSSLRCTPTELPDFSFDGHGEPVNVVFAVACVCGGSSFTVMGHLVEGELPEPPITLECAACEAAHTIFDASRHGYDGTVDGIDVEPDGEPRELFWDELEPPHEVLIRFEYPSDVLGDAQWQGKEHELFSWISVVGRGANGPPTLVFEYECA